MNFRRKPIDFSALLPNRGEYKGLTPTGKFGCVLELGGAALIMGGIAFQGLEAVGVVVQVAYHSIFNGGFDLPQTLGDVLDNTISTVEIVAPGMAANLAGLAIKQHGMPEQGAETNS